MNAVNIEYYNYNNGSYNCYYRKIIIFTMVYVDNCMGQGNEAVL